jgi:hypothetical protein
MKKPDWRGVVEGFGIVAIVASLIFVGLELQQPRKIAVADVHQQKVAMAIQVQQGLLVHEKYLTALNKIFQGESLNSSEKGLLQFSQNPWFQYWENTFFQYQVGLLSESSWLASRNAIRDRLRSPLYQEWWEIERSFWRAEFAQEVDAILVEDVERSSYMFFVRLPEIEFGG